MDVNWTAQNIPDISGKVVIVTGGNSGIGFESAKEFARNGAEVIMASRNPSRAEEAILKVKEEVPAAKLEFRQLDLASLASVRAFAEGFNSSWGRLDILMNNAGIMLVPYGNTADGFENTIGVNHLGHFALTGFLLESIKITPGARVVNISSNAHYGGEMDFDDMLFAGGRGYAPMKAYGRSKLANLLFTYELQRRFRSKKIDALALAAHPGISATSLADHMLNDRFKWLIQSAMKLLFQSSAMGALPGLRAAVDQQARGGQYYGPGGRGEHSGYPVVVDSNPVSKDQNFARRLWEISEKLTGVKYLS